MSRIRPCAPVYRAASPARIDLGAYIDVPKIFCSHPSGTLATFNAAIRKYVSVTMRTYSSDSDQFCLLTPDKEYRLAQSDLTSMSRLHSYPLNIMRFLNLPPAEYRLTSDFLPRTGLGGSSALTLSLLFLSRKIKGLHTSANDRYWIAVNAHIIESAFGKTTTGLQDQFASAFGGANLWIWGNNGNLGLATRRRLGVRGQHLLLNCGHLIRPLGSRGSNALSTRSLERLSIDNFAHWVSISSAAMRFFDALQRTDFTDAVRCMVEEMEIVSRVFPTMLGPHGPALMQVAQKYGGAARFCGFGHGGYYWALVPEQRGIAFRREVDALFQTPSTCEPINLVHRGAR